VCVQVCKHGAVALEFLYNEHHVTIDSIHQPCWGGAPAKKPRTNTDTWPRLAAFAAQECFDLRGAAAAAAGRIKRATAACSFSTERSWV
jgi:hypothetical protein